MWEDYVIAGVIVVFQLTLLPIIWAKIQLPWLTIIPMLMGSLVLVASYYSLALTFSTIVEAVASMLWTYILIGKVRYENAAGNGPLIRKGLGHVTRRETPARIR